MRNLRRRACLVRGWHAGCVNRSRYRATLVDAVRTWMGQPTESQTDTGGRSGHQTRNRAMPVLARFCGVVIRMLFSRGLPARFHAFYQGSEIVMEIFPLRVVCGEAPNAVLELIGRWARMHQSELLAAWRRCQQAQKPQPIAPSY